MMDQSNEIERVKKPSWLRVKLPIGESYRKVRSLVDEHKLHTICESGSCPNMGECWGEGTATFMILGNIIQFIRNDPSLSLLTILSIFLSMINQNLLFLFLPVQ